MIQAPLFAGCGQAGWISQLVNKRLLQWCSLRFCEGLSKWNPVKRKERSRGKISTKALIGSHLYCYGGATRAIMVRVGLYFSRRRSLGRNGIRLAFQCQGPLYGVSVCYG